MASPRIDLDSPIWDQSTFMGRLKYFAWVTDPRLSMSSTSTLLGAKHLVQMYRSTIRVSKGLDPDQVQTVCKEYQQTHKSPLSRKEQGQEPPGTQPEQVRRAQQLYLSAFHPDTGALQNVGGRMSFYVPGGMILIGAMITFYRSNTAVIFWQWANQSFNALVNYTNRNADSDITPKKIGIAYVSATGCALVTALGLKALLASRTSPLMQRFVPFAAVSAANMVNIPLMRQSELLDGIPVYDENGNKITESRYAAVKGISQVTFSRILMATPGMTLLPYCMEYLEKTAWLQKYKILNAPLQVLLSGVTLLFMVPIGCALFNQKCSIPVDRLSLVDGKSQETMEDTLGRKLPVTVYFNKGL